MTDDSRPGPVPANGETGNDAPAGLASFNISARDLWSYEQDGGEYAPAAELAHVPNTPEGKVEAFVLPPGRTYPEVPHRVSLYVPHRLRAAKANVMLFLDGSDFLKMGTANLLDTLIHTEAISPMVGVFVDAGDVGPGYPIYGGNDNRSVEYDTADETYAQFLTSEVMPAVRERLRFTISESGNGVAGMSSSAAAAFGVAWHRPEMFARVISAVGSFVDIRGADRYPTLIRREEPKPLRVFLQSGENDLDTIFGNWPLANKAMASALAYRGYAHRFEYGLGGHNLRQFTSLFPDAMRWIWETP